MAGKREAESSSGYITLVKFPSRVVREKFSVNFLYRKVLL
jgi:hypothetical protein